MKIKLSKSQWEGIGKKAGWMKVSQNTTKEIRYFKRIQDGWENDKSKLYKMENGNLSVLVNNKWQVMISGGISFSENSLIAMGLKEVSKESIGERV